MLVVAVLGIPMSKVVIKNKPTSHKIDAFIKVRIMQSEKDLAIRSYLVVYHSPKKWVAP